MYGTVARTRVKPENREALVEVLRRQSTVPVPGFRSAHLMFPEGGGDEAILVVVFDDRDSYVRNADDPAQDERYREYRALMEEDPTWSDGEWHTVRGGGPSG